jgi:hypothetical protein
LGFCRAGVRPQSYHYNSCIAGMAGMCHHSQLIDWGWPWTSMVLVSTSRVTGTIVMSHHTWPDSYYCLNILWKYDKHAEQKSYCNFKTQWILTNWTLLCHEMKMKTEAHQYCRSTPWALWTPLNVTTFLIPKPCP